jgi:hypothetical protein
LSLLPAFSSLWTSSIFFLFEEDVCEEKRHETLVGREFSCRFFGQGPDSTSLPRTKDYMPPASWLFLSLTLGQEAALFFTGD